MSREFTAQEMRYVADTPIYIVNDSAMRTQLKMRLMLLYAADVVERCEKIEKECIPLLDEIFRQYGCDGKRCGHYSCPNGKPCHAIIAKDVADELRKLRGDAGKEN